MLHLAEFGIVFLLFSLGLEFSIPKVLALRRVVFGAGPLLGPFGAGPLFGPLFGAGPLFGPLFGGVWGWDQNNFNKEESTNEDGKEGTNEGLVEHKCGNDGNRKCFRTKEGSIPFTVLIATIFMPPLGVFMEFGLSYWLNIVICIILTMFYYLPGLIYALLIIFN